MRYDSRRWKWDFCRIPLVSVAIDGVLAPMIFSSSVCNWSVKALEFGPSRRYVKVDSYGHAPVPCVLDPICYIIHD